ncbi:putative 6-phosphofructo-2-kinase, Fructose-2,6-bisphosphate 2-phosphatase [Helianthus annuus]|uniref:6-phosphofructo-2-kinase, Fructose-2,6-bisphosphate 2-phosphatase n=1 Tax=Helianthus annuus TaxID=4232 RepID=A0A9K3P3V1_HELAN|nr:putative 6-phosphofructo-2-kinase, Fructose-2,6-bisphosphate 2-phosphatase [Helianthus annuus]
MNKKTAFLTFKDPEALEFALLLSAVLRDLYAYFADRPMKEIPHIEVLLFFFGY